MTRETPIALLRPLGVYVGLAALVSWPLVLHLTSRLGSTEGPGDPYLNLWILGWDLRTLTAQPFALLNGQIFNANIFFPADTTLAYSEHLILQALVLWPLYLISRHVVLCYNVLLLGSMIASAGAMHLFVRQVTGSRWAAYTAAIIWAFGPFHFAHLLHLQLQAFYFLPLACLFLHRLLAGGRWRDALALGVAGGLQGVASVYYGVIGAVGLVCGSVVLRYASGGRHAHRLLGRLAVALLVAAAIVGPFAWPYWLVQQREGFARNLYEAGQHEAIPTSYLQAPPVNLLYGRTGLLAPAAERPTTHPARGTPEQQLFPGALALVLAIIGLGTARRRGSVPLAASMAAVAVVGFLLSLGPGGLGTAYAVVYRLGFGFQAIRAPARFAVLVVFGLAVLAGLGMREVRLHATGVGRRVMSVALLALLTIEYLNGRIPYVPAPARNSATSRWLREAPAPGAVIYLPLALDRENTISMVESLEHGRPLVNGYSGWRPAFFVPLVDTMAQFPSAESLWTLRDLNVRYVVSPRPIDLPPDRTPLAERAKIDGRFIYELQWTSEVEARLPRPEAPAPPPPGPLPFAHGEQAVYRMEWVSPISPKGVAAGQAIISVASPRDRGDGFRFSVTAETAPWVSRFFEAQDRLETEANPALLPLVHRQRLREGRRRLDQVLLFDHARRVVHLSTGRAAGQPAGAVALPISAATRDPISAFFYIRTLDLAPGDRLQVPVNASGRNLVVELAAPRVEQIAFGGQMVEAARFEPKFVHRIDRRPPVRVTAWISRDARRIPLVIGIKAPFGEFRAKLISYRAR